MPMDLNDSSGRLNYILEIKDISTKDLYLKTERHPNTITNYKKGNRKPDWEFLQQLKEMIPDLNLNWFIMGVGEPFLGDTNDETENKEVKVKEQHNKILEAKLAKLETFVNSMNEQFTEVKQLAMEGLEKLRGVASVRLITTCNQFVNTQNLHLCK